ncbi:single-strand DNA-binding protein [Crossiella equi]|uniref:Single-stranded DNA-binding protein n=1 Tax=Crossiella equi TaxID=130796 RepID=A0ABS5AM60_9PSEU|nr:single-stranded DNA-binding protein [Crossiella equi]MBP2477648.1 single-strand DNA-binding protein [Crossiella equi]
MNGATTTVITGCLTADPELRRTHGGVAVCNFNVSAARFRYDHRLGEQVSGVPVILRCTAWEAQARNVVASLRKGDRVVVYGRLRARTVTAPSGHTRTALDIDIEECGPSLLAATAVPAPTPDDPESSEEEGDGLSEEQEPDDHDEVYPDEPDADHDDQPGTRP